MRRRNGSVEAWKRNLYVVWLAQMTAMTSSTVNRLLTNWENQGLLKVRREAIEIHNFLRLLSLCKVA